MHFKFCFALGPDESLNAKIKEIDTRYGHPDDNPTIGHRLDSCGTVIDIRLWLADQVWQHAPYAYVDKDFGWHEMPDKNDTAWDKEWFEASGDLARHYGWDTIFVYCDVHR